MADDKENQTTKPADEEKKEEEEELDLPNVWMKVTVNGKPCKTSSGDKIVYKLYDDLCPKTCANFRSLCTGRRPGPNVSAHLKAICPGLLCDGSALPANFGYAPNTPFHRVIPGFMVQSGDFERRDGTGGVSIYGEKFPDEKFDKKGLLAMANNGKDANGSQFFVTTVNECEWLDGKHVIFGEVIEGYDIIKEIESRGNKEGKMPRDKILIAAAGAV
ncbi:hypothetical protein IAR50_004854 [Cryptococcus sp. DSM 104548]